MPEADQQHNPPAGSRAQMMTHKSKIARSLMLFPPEHLRNIHAKGMPETHNARNLLRQHMPTPSTWISQGHGFEFIKAPYLVAVVDDLVLVAIIEENALSFLATGSEGKTFGVMCSAAKRNPCHKFGLLTF